MAIERINPPTLSKPTGYTQVVRATGSRTIFLAGQVSADADGKVVGVGDFAAQAQQVFANLKSALAAAGAGFEHVVKTTTYIVNYSPDVRPARHSRSAGTGRS